MSTTVQAGKCTGTQIMGGLAPCSWWPCKWRSQTSGRLTLSLGPLRYETSCLSLRYCRILSDTHVQWFNL